jgi:hypothetical protein
MSRSVAAAIAAATVVLIAVSALAAPGPAQDCADRPCTYIPIIAKAPAPTATATVSPTPTLKPTVAPTPIPTLPPSYNNCQADPNATAAPNEPVDIVTINKQAETVTLQNVSASPVDLTGWEMCSILGNQHHPIFGTLAPGQSQTFSGPAGNIWNNSSRDDGALYNPAGRLVSYFFD